MSLDMLSKRLRECFEGIALQTCAINSHKSVKDTDVGCVLTHPNQDYPNGVERNLNPRFLIVIPIRRFQGNFP